MGEGEATSAAWDLATSASDESEKAGVEKSTLMKERRRGTGEDRGRLAKKRRRRNELPGATAPTHNTPDLTKGLKIHQISKFEHETCLSLSWAAERVDDE